MRLYLAGAESTKYETLEGIEGLRFLLSYHYVSRDRRVLDWAIDHKVPVFLDSGAFSAFASGATIDLDEYIRFCVEYQDRLEAVASLDVIGDHEATLRNHRLMVRAGVRSIPTFHVRSPFSALEELAWDSPYIALGVAGMQRRRKAIMAWLVRAFGVMKSVNPDIKVHGFALTSTRIMRWLPWYSVDSTTWLDGRRYGTVLLNELGEVKHFPKWRAKQLVSRYHRVHHLLGGPTAGYPWYTSIDVWNAKEMLSWSQSLTPHGLTSFATGQPTVRSAQSPRSPSPGNSTSSIDPVSG